MSGYGMPSFDPSVGEADAYEAGPGGDLVAELFDEIDGAGRIAAGDGLVEQLWVNAGTQTQLLGVARDSLVRAEDAHDAAQAAYAAVRAATGPLDASSVPGRRSGFTSSYGDLRRMLGKRPMDVQGVSRSKDWAQVERDAERLIAAAMGLPNASEGKPHEEGSAERRGPRVSADAFHDGAGSQPAETTAGEVAMSAWVVLWVGEVESFEVAAGIMEVSSAGELRWSEPPQWTEQGVEWLNRAGIDTSVLLEHELAEAEAGLEL